MSVVDRIFEDLDTRNVVKATIAGILRDFEQRLDDLELEKLEIPLVTDLAIAKLHTLIDLATLQYDGMILSDEAFEKMTPDGEPYPERIDSWARGIGTYFGYFMANFADDLNSFIVLMA